MNTPKNPVAIALSEVFMDIPHDILAATFRDRNKYPYQSIDEAIRVEVLDKFLAPRLNLVGGSIKDIPLRSEFLIPPEYVQPNGFTNMRYQSVYRIPPHERDYKPISTVIRIGSYFAMTQPGAYGGNNHTYNYGRTMGSLASQVLESQTYARTPVFPVAEAIGTDMVALISNALLPNIQEWVATCKLEYDYNFTNLNQQSILTFGRLLNLATKMFIYNELSIPLARGYIEGGFDLTVVSERVAEYREAREKFDEEILNFRGANLLSAGTLEAMGHWLF